MKVLLLEDDVPLCDIVSEHLKDRDFDVTQVYNGEDALEILIEEKFDFALLDINTPLMSGLDVLKSIREYKINTPVIIITAYQDTKHLKEAFENSADDYIKKPFDLEELDQRINKLCRYFSIEQNDKIQITENIYFLAQENSLYKDEQQINIAQKEADILKYFCTHANRIISSEELLQNIWAYEDMPSDATIRVYIKNLRELVGKEKIKTLRGIGYKFEL